MSNEISVTYLRDLARSYRVDAQPQLARALTEAADTITALRAKRNYWRRSYNGRCDEHRAAVSVAAKQEKEISALQFRLRKCGQAETRARVVLEQATYELSGMRRDRDLCAQGRDDNARRLKFLLMAARDQAKFAGIE